MVEKNGAKGHAGLSPRAKGDEPLQKTKSVRWKSGQVISIETRDGVFVLAQMGPSPFLVIFSHFRDSDNDWGTVRLNQASVLFCRPVTRQFLRHSTIRVVTEVLPLTPVSYPNAWIDGGGESRRVTLWAGTSDELSFFVIGKGGGRLVHNDITVPGFKEQPVIMESIPASDIATIEGHELTSIAVYPEFNERLYLCSRSGCNVDPDKELLFDQEMPLAYKRFFQIRAG